MVQGQHGRSSLIEGLSESRPEVQPAKNRRSRTWRLAIAATTASAALVLLGFVVVRGIRERANDPGVASRIRAVIDAETGEVLPEFRIRDGTSIPWRNPKTGRDTLYPATECFWTADGKAKLEPTYVLLNEYVGKPGPTYCPECGRVVVPHNPLPPAHLLIEAAQAAGAQEKK